MAKMGASKRSVLRFAIYIKGLGGEPLPYAYKDYRPYAVALQSQYDELRRTLDPTVVKAARTAGRNLIRTKTLSIAASDLVPSVFAIAKPINAQQIPGKKVSTPRTDEAQDLPASSLVQEIEVGNPVKTKRQNAKDIWNCRRKLRHEDFLSALQHASQLGSDGIHIYPCLICSGLHVGHDPSNEIWKKRKKTRKKLIRLERRLERKQASSTKRAPRF